MVKYWTDHSTFLSYVCYIVRLSLFYSVEVLLFKWVYFQSYSTFFELITLKNIEWLCVFSLNLFLGLTFVLFIVSSFLIESYWTVAKWMKSERDRSQTAIAIMWTFVCTTPLSLFCLFLSAAMQANLHGLEGLIVILICLTGLLSTVIAGFVVLLKSFSEIHKFSLSRSFLLIVLGTFFLFPLVLRLYAISEDEGLFFDHIKNLE